MTQSGGNGHKSDISSDDLTIYEPAYAPGDEDEPVGWWRTEPGEEDGEFIPDLSTELDDPESPTSSN